MRRASLEDDLGFLDATEKGRAGRVGSGSWLGSDDLLLEGDHYFFLRGRWPARFL